ncbi:hypothetical protein ILUMI_18053 [Ignelater luminosus]|uniref:Transposase n=1 Tax=Ignelater luminosus TaxID=2038154 RepID=A0A8K0G1A1_IGNLU|nr:hypothetical protein ILUMI_18053 [Ignelater luminosus]
MASQINPPSQRQMGKIIVRKKLQVHRLTKVKIEKRKKRSWGLYRALNNGKWKKYITTDEAWFYINNVNGARRIQIYGVGWGKTKLHLIDPGAKVNSTYYINNVLKPFLTKDALRLYPDGDFVFHHDSAPSHVSKVTTEFMKDKLKFNSQEKWMPKSPDVVPMDYFVWGYMKQQLWRTKAKDVAALKRAVKRVCKDMPQELVYKALASWPKRCLKIHKNKEQKDNNCSEIEKTQVEIQLSDCDTKIHDPNYPPNQTDQKEAVDWINAADENDGSNVETENEVVVNETE